MKNDQDTRVAKYQEYQAKGMTLYSEFGQSFAFYEPEFMYDYRRAVPSFLG